MPIHRCSITIRGKKYPCYQYGNQKKYPYEPGDEKSRKAAYEKAVAQMRAIRASGYQE